MLALLSMRAVAVLLLLAACGRSSDAGPKWPKASEKESDGGESLAPHVARGASGGSTSSATIEEDDDEEDAKPATTAATDKAADKSEPAAIPTTDDMLFDDFTIEIEDE